MKRLLSLILVVLMISAMIIPTALADEHTYYVKTDNGKSLNVRKTPNGEVIGSFAYGRCIYVEKITSSGWAQTYYGDYGDSTTAWVMARYLVKEDPGKYKASSSSSKSSSSSSSSSTSSSTTEKKSAEKVLSEMNAEFKTGKKVINQFTVVARPARASGWVNLRWAPSTEAERITTCSQGKELTVIGETKNWYQVEDPQTGMVGYISKQYVTAK